ncbi:MD-2-related lipid-recognition protein-like [Sitodiplosis mosellana]|uniref:MD-2-related lipid-recognition protein-like n=1 Tax=Sitodiplosis mosellana TaxID=263140 RepID=UPI002444C47B|nr:MD-2-related lipid-recognition protein-like [Sitodiplosis mosellana]
MATSYFFLVSLCLTWLVCGLNAEVVKTETCYSTPGQCKISEVRIDPCREASENRPCVVRRGTNAQISFDFTPEWSVPNVYSNVYSVGDEGDLPMPGMDTDGCKFTSCPFQASTKQTYTYNLPIQKKFPKGSYLIKWILRDLANETNTDTMCCFTTRIKLIK